MMFGESLLMENSVNAFGANGAGSKLTRFSEVKDVIPENEKEE